MPARASACTHPHVHACAHPRAVHAGTDTHTHTHSPQPTTTGGRWKLPGLGKAPNLQLHLCQHPEAAEPADHHLSLQSQTSHAGLVQAASAQSPTSLMQDSASTSRAQPAHLFLVPLPVFTSSAQPVRAQLWVFNVETRSAPSSASSGDQTPLQAGSRGCCPTATWGLPTRLHKCISQPQAGRGITCRQATFKTIFLVVSGARGQPLGWKGYLGTGRSPNCQP